MYLNITAKQKVSTYKQIYKLKLTIKTKRMGIYRYKRMKSKREVRID